MATELEVKARERRELLDEIRKRRAAAAQAEGSLGAAEQGQYGDVGQGQQGDFDDIVDQDPGNEDVTASKMTSGSPQYGMIGTMGPYQEFFEQGVGDETLGSRMLGLITKGKLFDPVEFPSSGFGQPLAAENIPILKDMDPISRGVYNAVAPYVEVLGEKALDVLDTAYRFFGAGAADIAQLTGVSEDDVNEIQAAVNTAIGTFIPQGNPVMTAQATNQAVMSVLNATNKAKRVGSDLATDLMYYPEILRQEIVPSLFGFKQPIPKGVGAASVAELTEEFVTSLKNAPLQSTNLSSLDIIGPDGLTYVRTGKNRYMLKEDATLVEKPRKDRLTGTLYSYQKGDNESSAITNLLSMNPKNVKRRDTFLKKKEGTFIDTRSDRVNDIQAVFQAYLDANYKKVDGVYQDVPKFWKDEAKYSKFGTELLQKYPELLSSEKLGSIVTESKKTGIKKLEFPVKLLEGKQKTDRQLLVAFTEQFPNLRRNTDIFKELNENPEFRFVHSVARSSPNLFSSSATDGFTNFSKLFKEVNPNDLNKPGTKYYKAFQEFKEVDNVRVQVNELLQPVLKKMFGGTQSVQLAHTYKVSKVGKEKALEPLAGKGGEYGNYYLDFSQVNFLQQEKGFEKQARKIINEYNKNPTIENAQKILNINEKYKESGVTSIVGSPTSEVGYKFGNLVPFRDRLIKFMDASREKFGENFFSPNDLERVEEALQIIEGNPLTLNLARGGLATIDYMTRPLSA